MQYGALSMVPCNNMPSGPFQLCAVYNMYAFDQNKTQSLLIHCQNCICVAAGLEGWQCRSTCWVHGSFQFQID